MTINLFLIYVYRFITWYRRLEKQQQLSVKVSMRWDVLWPTLRLIYVVVKFKRLKEVKHLEVALTENKIAYRESVEDANPSMSVLGLSLSI